MAEKKVFYDFDGLKISDDEVQYWVDQVKQGRAFRKKFFYDDDSHTGKAIDCINYYLGAHDILNEGIETPIVDNQIAPIVNTFMSAIIHRNPELIIKMKRESDIPHQAEITKAVYSYFQEELKMEWHNQQAAFDGYVTGMGVKTNGYDTEFDSMDEKEIVKTVKKKRKGLGRGKGSKMIEEEVEEELVRRREWIVKEFPSNQRHSPLMTIVDPMAKSAMPYDGKWVTLEWDLKYNEVKGNSDFKHTKDLKPSGAIGTDKDKVQWDDYKKSIIRIYQIQISRKDGLYVLTLAKDYDKPLRFIKYPFPVEGFLTTFLTMNDTIDAFYGPSDIERLIPLQDEVNYIQSRILEAIYKFLPKIGINRDALPDEEEAKNAILKGDIGTVITTQGQQTSQQAIQVLNFNLDLRDKASVLQALKTEMRLISGVTEAELSGRTSADTATEASIGQRGSTARIESRRERLRRFLKEDLRKFKQICQQACDFPLITKITGIREQDPQTGEFITEQWVNLNRVNDYITGEYDLDIDIISGQQPNPELKRRQILESMNFLFSPVIEQKLAREGFKVDAQKAIEEYLRTMDQFRAEGLIVPMNRGEMQALQQAQMMQSGGLKQLAQAPQGDPGAAPQGEAQTFGEMVAGARGTI